MAELEPKVLDAVEHRGKNLLPKEFLTLVERFDESVERGVPMERLEAYAAALEERGADTIDPGELAEIVDEHLTDEESWVDSNAIYDVGDGVSSFPARWHDELTGEEDVKQYVDLISGDLSSEGKGTASGAAGEGVPQQLLLDAVSALGPYSREGAKTEVEELRAEGLVEERADQHPQARIWPSHE